MSSKFGVLLYTLMKKDAVQHLLKIITGGPLRWYLLALLGVIVPHCMMHFERLCALGSCASREFTQRQMKPTAADNKGSEETDKQRAWEKWKWPFSR